MTINKIILEQREANPTTKKSTNRNPTKRIAVNSVDGSVGFMKDTLPSDFTPDKAIVALESIEFKAPVVDNSVEYKQYNNDVIVRDVNGLECISDQTLFTNLGITDPSNIRRTSTKLKNLKCKDTGDKMFIQGVDYLELDVTNSKTIGVAQRMISHDTPLVDNTKPVSRWADSTIDSAVANSDMCFDSSQLTNRNTSADTIPAVANATNSDMCFDSSQLTNRNTSADSTIDSAVANSDMDFDSSQLTNRNPSDMVGIYTKDMNRRKDTVWTVPAAKRIATLSATTAGNVYHEHLTGLEHKHSKTNVNFNEALIELQNDRVGVEIPQIKLPDNHKRVEDVTRDMNVAVSHQEACSIGRLATRLSKATGVDPVKVNSSKYPTAFVNAYPDKVLDDVIKDYAGPDNHDPEDAIHVEEDDDGITRYY